jgi:hypothetical protein
MAFGSAAGLLSWAAVMFGSAQVSSSCSSLLY